MARQVEWFRVASLTLMLVSSPALAGDKVMYQPLPDWVKDAGKLTPSEASSDGWILADYQHRIADKGLTQYQDFAVRATSTQALMGLGTLSFEWFPDKGDLVIHRIEIIRDGQIIDVANQAKSFTVLHREKELEAQVIDGRLTATMQVEGLKVGDILRYTYSITFKDPALDGNVEIDQALLVQPTKIARAHYRLLYPNALAIKWRVLPTDVHPHLAALGDDTELMIDLPLAKQPDSPQSAPPRFTPSPIFEASSFAKWEDVSRVESKLFPQQGLIPAGSSLAARVATIAAHSTDPRVRAAEALRVVQEDIRYFLNGQHEGNLAPQLPIDTWQKRYGDCKAKSLLLVAMLNALGINAVPALAHASEGDLIPAALPSFAAFNHMIARAEIGGKIYWLDGTLTGARLADLGDTPPYHFALPVRPEGAALEPISYTPPARPTLAIDADVDNSAAIALPAVIKLRAQLTGPVVQAMKKLASETEKKKLNETLDAFIRQFSKDIGIIGSRSLTVDDEAAVATVQAVGLQQIAWKKEGERTTHQIGGAISALDLSMNRAKPEWHDVPVAATLPFNLAAHFAFHLPSNPGFRVENLKNDDEHVAFWRYKHVTRADGAHISVDVSLVADQYEMAAADLPAARSEAARLLSNPTKLIAPDDLPPPWKQQRAAYAATRTGAIEAIYAQAIADEPDEAKGYLARAQFYAEVDNRPAAIADLTKALALAPNAATYFARARLYQYNDPEKAIADIKAVQQTEPGSVPAAFLLSRIYQLAHKPDLALAVIDAALPLQEDQTVLKGIRAEVLALSGHGDQAKEIVDQLVADAPGKSQVLNQRCWEKAISNTELDSALKDCSLAIENAQNPSSIYDSRGLVNYRLHRFEEALADFNAAIRANPHSPQSLYVRGLTRLAKGMTKEGNDDLRDATALEPNVAQVNQLYGLSRPK